MDKKQAAWLDKAVGILGLTLAGVVAFSLAAGVVAVMLKWYLGGKRQNAESRNATSRKDDSLQAASNEVSDLLDWLRRQFLRFSRSYESAVQDGANEAFMALVASVGELGRPSDIPVGKLLSAIRTGVLHAGQQLLESGRDQFGQLMRKDGQDS